MVLFGEKKELWKEEEVFRVSKREDQERRDVWLVIPLGEKEMELLGFLESGEESRVKLMQEKNSGAKLNSTGGGLYLGKERAGREPRQEKEMTKKEPLILFPRRGGRRRRVKRPRKTAIWLRLCSSAKLQSF